MNFVVEISRVNYRLEVCCDSVSLFQIPKSCQSQLVSRACAEIAGYFFTEEQKCTDWTVCKCRETCTDQDGEQKGGEEQEEKAQCKFGV